MSRPVPRRPRARAGLITDRRMEWEAAFRETPQYARHVIAQKMGVKINEVPSDLAEAHIMRIKLLRELRKSEAEALPPILVAKYTAGATTRDLAQEFGLNRQRIGKMLRSAGLDVPPRRTACKHGHEFTPENTYWTPQGARHCRQCSRETCKRQYRKRAGRAAQAMSAGTAKTEGLGGDSPASAVAESDAPKTPLSTPLPSGSIER